MKIRSLRELLGSLLVEVGQRDRVRRFDSEPELIRGKFRV